MFRHFIFILLLASATSLSAQMGPHGAHAKHFRQNSAQAYKDSAGLSTTYSRSQSKKCLPTAEVYGWHPAWSADAFRDYDFPLLNTFSHFAYEVDPATGSYLSIGDWKTTEAVQMAHDGGAQVDLTVFCSGPADINRLFSRASNKTTLRDSVMSLLVLRDADGLCLDFEGMDKKNGQAFVELVKILSDTLHRSIPRRKLTVTLPVGNAQAAYFLKDLNPFVDRFALKAYDFGPSQKNKSVAPLLAVDQAVEKVLASGIKPGKLLLGVPYFATEWTSAKEKRPILQRNLTQAVQGMKPGRVDSLPMWTGASPEHQVWAEDSLSLALRFDMVKRKGLAGVAVWALGYDHGSDTFWNLIRRHFADCSAEETQYTEKEKNYDNFPGSGLTSAERNQYNWIWMLGGGAVAIVIMLIVRRLLR